MARVLLGWAYNTALKKNVAIELAIKMGDFTRIIGPIEQAYKQIAFEKTKYAFEYLNLFKEQDKPKVERLIITYEITLDSH